MRAEAITNATAVVTGSAEDLVAMPRPIAKSTPLRADETVGGSATGRLAMGNATAIDVIENQRPHTTLTAANADRPAARNANQRLKAVARAVLGGCGHTKTGADQRGQTRAPGTQRPQSTAPIQQ